MEAMAATVPGSVLSPAHVKGALRSMVTSDPMGALFATVAGGAWLFYLAERGQNEKVTSYWDALVFVTTSLSVGYASVFAVTPAGKAIASALMTLGPALSGMAFDDPAEGARASQVQEKILEKLEGILDELRARA